MKYRGITLCEVLVSLLCFLLAIIPLSCMGLSKARDTAKVTQSKSNIHQVSVALRTYASDHNDRHFTTAPDNLSSGNRSGMNIKEAVESLDIPNTYPMGIKLGEYAGNGYIYFIGVPNWCGVETGGIAPYCFKSGLTTSSTGKDGYGTWRYPNALQVAEYMEGKPLYKAYFAPKDTVPLKAIEDCGDTSGSYCPTSAMSAVHSGANPVITSNMLAIPSSYCISPSMMYSPEVYSGLGIDPMATPRGFKPPTINQAKYPSHKTWVMEHNLLQSRLDYGCASNWAGTWFLSGDGSYDGCEPLHFNSDRSSEPVTSFADGSVRIFNVAMASENYPLLWNDAMSFDKDGYYNSHGIDGFSWSGHTHTKDGIRGRDIIEN